MRHFLIIAFIFFIAPSLCGQSNVHKETRYTLKGRIITKNPLPPHCGTSSMGTLIQFEIIDFSDRAYTGKSIDVIISSPESFNEGFFETGNIYELKMSDKSKASLGWAIPNEGSADHCPTNYTRWLVSAKKAG